ncbi:RHS repeat-associated core domain-containing protein [Bacteroides heparinolyticus]|uniref:RHS repeat-associated core domain-containing protein n=1 Tax=Prevotella heparinolytica TaxID=28113 RepID=UPI0035A0CF02
MYDPVIGRFFSPDPFVQAPGFTQNYNRYSYCLNNPVMFTDPDGEWVHIAVCALIGGSANLISQRYNIDNFWEGLVSFSVGAGAGALTAVNPFLGSVVGSAISNGTNEIMKSTGKGKGFSEVDWGNVAVNTVIGAGTGALSYGAGQLVGNIKIGKTPIAEKILDACGVKKLNARTFLGNAINGTLAGGASGTATGIVQGSFTGNWDIWNYTWRGSAYGFGGSLAYSGLTTLGYQAQLKYGRQPNLNSTTIESVSVSADNAINQLNTYETPVETIGTFELPEIDIVSSSPTSANVFLHGFYHPYLIPPKSYTYNSPTLLHLLPLLQLP